MNTTEQLNRLQGHAAPAHPSSGAPGRIWAADIVTVNPDGTVDAQPVATRATKVSVPVPGWYSPAVGDRALLTDLNGDPRSPVLIAPFAAAAALTAHPTGPAGRDLSGTYPNPEVATVLNGKTPLVSANNLNDVANTATAVENLAAAFGGLGVLVVNSPGPSGGQTFANPVNLTGMSGSLVVKNPTGTARVLVMGQMAGVYVPSGGPTALLLTYVSMDSGSNQTIGEVTFNSGTAIRLPSALGAFVFTNVSAGSHTFYLSAYDANVIMEWDASSWATLIAVELP